MKTAQKKEALILRREGYSLGELSQLFGISKSTASLWTKDVILSEAGIARIQQNRDVARKKSGEISHNKMLSRLSIANTEADALLSNAELNLNTKMCILAMIYECEGGKGKRLCFTNSDQSLVGYFLTLLRECFSIDEAKLRCIVHLHDYHDKEQILAFWSGITNIPLSQFNKSYTKESNHKFRKEGYRGCVHVYYNDVHVKRVIQSFAKKLINTYSSTTMPIGVVK